MAGAQLEAFLRRLRRVLGPQTAEQVTDAQLLVRFVQQSGVQAFELLVFRHGLTVLERLAARVASGTGRRRCL